MSSTENAWVHSVEFSTKSVTRKGQAEEIDLAELRVNVDRSRRDGENEDGTPRYRHDRSFWVSVEMWGPRVRHLRGRIAKGVSILMAGRYDGHTWTDKKTGEVISRNVFVAEEIAIQPRSIVAVTFKERKKESAPVDAGESGE